MKKCVCVSLSPYFLELFCMCVCVCFHDTISFPISCIFVIEFYDMEKKKA